MRDPMVCDPVTQKESKTPVDAQGRTDPRVGGHHRSVEFVGFQDRKTAGNLGDEFCESKLIR